MFSAAPLPDAPISPTRTQLRRRATNACGRSSSSEPIARLVLRTRLLPSRLRGKARSAPSGPQASKAGPNHFSAPWRRQSENRQIDAPSSLCPGSVNLCHPGIFGLRRSTRVDSLTRSQPKPDRSKLDEGKAVVGEFVVACRDPAALLNPAEGPFDLVAGTVVGISGQDGNESADNLR